MQKLFLSLGHTQKGLLGYKKYPWVRRRRRKEEEKEEEEQHEEEKEEEEGKEKKGKGEN